MNVLTVYVLLLLLSIQNLYIINYRAQIRAMGNAMERFYDFVFFIRLRETWILNRQLVKLYHFTCTVFLI